MTVIRCAHTTRVVRAAGHRARPPRRSHQSGYALMMVLFMVASFIILSQMSLQHLATQGRRHREQRMEWSGEQYIRAIKLYYRKTGHYPQSLEDLQKGIPGVHFLRIEAYKNPMDPDEGSWRLIYTNPAGQIIGSTRYATLQQMAYLELNRMSPTQPAVPGLSSSQQSSSERPVDDGCGPPSPTAPNAGGQNSAGQTSAGATSFSLGSSGTNVGSQGAQNSFGQSSSGQQANPFAGLQPTGPANGPVIGGFLTGVGGKGDVCSVTIYKGARKYSDWEFIWNPVLDQARATQQQLSGAVASGGAGGTGTTNNTPPTTPPPSPTPAQNY